MQASPTQITFLLCVVDFVLNPTNNIQVAIYSHVINDLSTLGRQCVNDATFYIKCWAYHS